MSAEYKFLSSFQPKSLCQTPHHKLGTSADMAKSASDSEKVEFGKRVALRRKEVKLTQKELADAAGMSQQNISAIENGTTERPGMLRELAAALSVSEAWLLGETADREALPTLRFIPLDEERSDAEKLLLRIPVSERKLALDFLEFLALRAEERLQLRPAPVRRVSPRETET